MQVRIQMKSKAAGGWNPINPAEVKGSTLREALAALVGEMVVTEVDIDGKKVYCCGTEQLKVMMSTRGQAVTNQGAGRLLDMINPAILEIQLLCDLVGQVFDGSQLESITARLPDLEEQQSTLFESKERQDGTP